MFSYVIVFLLTLDLATVRGKKLLEIFIEFIWAVKTDCKNIKSGI